MGVVTDTDLMGLGRHTPFAAQERDRARRAPSQEVAAAGRELPAVVTAMVDARADPIDVGRVVALVVDAMTERLLQLAIADHGDPPCAWAWLALGSAARHEQALRTDQDHALAYDPIAGQPDADPYFAELAEFVTAGLEAAGIPRCNGDAMATHPALRRPIDRVRRACSPTGWIAPTGRPRCCPRSGTTSDRSPDRSMPNPSWSTPCAGRGTRPSLRPAAVASGARPDAADRVRPRPGGAGQGRARRAARHQARRHHDREQPRSRVGGPRRRRRRRARSPAWMPPRSRRTDSTPSSRANCPRPSISCGTSGSGIRPTR